MKKLFNSEKSVITLLFCFVLLSGCADWKSQPVTVDENRGTSVKNMVANQTLNPGSAFADQPVLGLEGQKAEGNINVYRKAGTTDLNQGKETLELTIDSGN